MVPPPQVKVQLLQGLHLGLNKNTEIFEGHAMDVMPWISSPKLSLLKFALASGSSNLQSTGQACLSLQDCNYSNYEPRWLGGCGNYINMDSFPASLLHSNHYHIHGKNLTKYCLSEGLQAKATIRGSVFFFRARARVAMKLLTRFTHTWKSTIGLRSYLHSWCQLVCFFRFTGISHSSCRRCIVCSPSCCWSTACSHSPTTSLWGKQWGGWHLRIHGCVSDLWPTNYLRSEVTVRRYTLNTPIQTQICCWQVNRISFWEAPKSQTKEGYPSERWETVPAPFPPYHL